ncbi:hypothetical protein WISP_33457 [Willisornis vidua]|uniref:Uncharacterized protein n=1 Tax=Willisornis vidua TaxID=1566151 RepID=A0ABQ9DKS1_9PASS|nr:hypothetical protein WISP_33457 [Willisornis vidua]
MTWTQDWKGYLSKFADDIKLGGALQRDLNKLEHWAITNCVKFYKGSARFYTWDGATLDKDDDDDGDDDDDDGGG